jgi:type II secretory pathway pseudopilin PulG
MPIQQKQSASIIQRGFILIEVMLVTTMFIFGFVAGNKIVLSLIKAKTSINQESQAVEFANQKIEQLRNYTDLTSYSAIASGSDTITGRNTTFNRVWTITSHTGYIQVDQTVSWTTMENQTESISISNMIALNDPRMSGQIFNIIQQSTSMPIPS